MPPGSAGYSLFIPTGAAPKFEDIFPNDPFYKQGNTNIDAAQLLAQNKLNQDRIFYDTDYQLQTDRANLSYDPNYDYGLGNAEAQAALSKQKAAHDNEMRAEYLNEWLTSRGLKDSGQTGLEQGEREYQFGAYNQGVDLGLAGQQQEVAHTKERAQMALQQQLAELRQSRTEALAGFDQQQAAIPVAYAGQRAQLAFDTFERLNASGALKAPGINAIWSEEDGLYVTQDGRYYDGNGIPQPNYTRPNAPIPQNTPGVSTSVSNTPYIDSIQATQPQYPVPEPFSYESAAGRTGRMQAY